jgi:ubiquitin
VIHTVTMGVPLGPTCRYLPYEIQQNHSKIVDFGGKETGTVESKGIPKDFNRLCKCKGLFAFSSILLIHEKMDESTQHD